ncbi:MAG: ATP-binding protein [Gemmatimonadetes bacterium]|nr:ATP-binding protein [Gemmatimonadota bacterium]
MERRENVVFLGAPGVGKTHLAISLAITAAQRGAIPFFQLVNRRYEHASTVVTPNQGFERWGEILHDEVMAVTLPDREAPPGLERRPFRRGLDSHVVRTRIQSRGPDREGA